MYLCMGRLAVANQFGCGLVRSRRCARVPLDADPARFEAIARRFALGGHESK